MTFLEEMWNYKNAEAQQEYNTDAHMKFSKAREKTKKQIP